jgi:DNA-binding transcriptional regulator YbjK
VGRITGTNVRYVCTIRPVTPAPTRPNSTPTRPNSTPTRPNSAPRRPRGAARREALLEATLALLGETGADAVTHRRVAERAGLPLASTTYWFQSKEHLLTETLQYAAERDERRLRDAADAVLTRAGSDGPPTVAEVVDVVLGAAGEDAGASRGSLMAAYALMLEAARRPALQELSQRWTEAYLETVGALLQRAGSPRPADDARLLIAATDGLLIDRLATGAEDTFDPRPELERLARALIGER